MPVTTIKKKRLIKLLGKDIGDEELVELLSNIKVEAEILDEENMQIEVTPDRLDLLISEGIARELKGVLGLEKGFPKYKIRKTNIKLILDGEIKFIRPYIAVAAIYGYYIDKYTLEELLQFQEKLNISMGRDRRKIAIGFYDLDKLNSNIILYRAEEPAKIKYTPLGYDRELTADEILELTDKGRKYAHLVRCFSKYPHLVTDKNQTLSMPPILNSEDTKVEESTRNLFIDITGTDKYTVEKTLDLIATTLAENAEYIGLISMVDGNEVYCTPKLEPIITEVGLEYIRNNLGMQNLTQENIISLLESLRHKVEIVNDQALKVISPPYRYDILHPIDIVEDVAIAIGYENLKPEVPRIFTIGKELKKTKYLRKLREIMIGLGFQEILTFTLSSSSMLEGMLGLERIKHVEILNPISPLYDTIRTSIIPNIIMFLKANQHEDHPVKVFEVGDTVVVVKGKPQTRTKLAAGVLSYKVGFEDIQAVLYSLADNLGLNMKLEEVKTAPKLFIKGRTAKIIVEGEERGIIGELNPRFLLEEIGIEYPIALFEVDVTDLWEKH
ncbi:MAG: phenylalanine--tRNA ligase subunit beta [Desulfurococcales archaeon ex4484_217_1]|nr:MAG: phenylalanine--tRNA ligase subunit beta [Desulfurococcales archaeon ex4484_217_1]